MGATPGPTAPDVTPARSTAPTSRPQATITAVTGASPRPLPACEYLDEPVLGDPARDWATLVLDTVFTLPEDFEPERLVGTRRAGLNGGFQVSRVMLDDLAAMATPRRPMAPRWRSSRRTGAVPTRCAPSRAGWTSRASRRHARSAHGPATRSTSWGRDWTSGSADDATPPWELDDFATTKAGAWLAEHAWEHGFVMSYPKGKRRETCYAYEPWHYRYVGRDVAAAIRESGLTPRRYLWETYWATGR